MEEQEHEDSVLDQLVVEYLQRREEGDEPEIGEYLPRLGDDTERSEFQSLVETAEWAGRSFPVPVRAQYIVGGRYRLLRELGAGGFGKVWAAHDEQLDRTVAVKILNLLTSSGTDTEAFFRRERLSLGRLQHPGCVTIHESGRSEDFFYLVMDLVPGKSASDVIAALCERDEASSSVPSTAELNRAIGLDCPAGQTSLITGDYYSSVASIVIEVLRTLEAAHEHEVLHRDIKPANIMLRGGGRPVLLDFGMASLRDQQTGTVTAKLVGTINYLGPEQVRDFQVGSDLRTDIYQVGLVLYKLLTLRPAFPAEGLGTVPDKIKRGDFRLPRTAQPKIPRELQDICLKAMELSPERRFQSAAEFREDVERYVAGDMPLASRTGKAGALLRMTRYSLRRHRVPVLIAGALLAGLTPFLIMTLSETPRLIVVESGDNRLVVQVAQPNDLFGLELLTDDSGRVDAVAPLRIRTDDGQDSGPSLPVVAGESLIRIDRRRPGSEVRLRLADGEAQRDQLVRAWQELERWMTDQGEGDSGVPLNEARGILDYALASGRSGDATGGLTTEDLLGPADGGALPDGWVAPERR